jgi:hypothetical protein
MTQSTDQTQHNWLELGQTLLSSIKPVVVYAAGSFGLGVQTGQMVPWALVIPLTYITLAQFKLVQEPTGHHSLQPAAQVVAR